MADVYRRAGASAGHGDQFRGGIALHLLVTEAEQEPATPTRTPASSYAPSGPAAPTHRLTRGLRPGSSPGSALMIGTAEQVTDRLRQLHSMVRLDRQALTGGEGYPTSRSSTPSLPSARRWRRTCASLRCPRRDSSPRTAAPVPRRHRTYRPSTRRSPSATHERPTMSVPDPLTPREHHHQHDRLRVGWMNAHLPFAAFIDIARSSAHASRHDLSTRHRTPYDWLDPP